MKISKIFAGVAALAMAASMAAISASAADSAYLYTVKTSWTGKAAADSVEGEIKFMTEEDGTAKTALGACDLNNWDSGSQTYNGQWAQYILTSDDVSGLTIQFDLTTNENTTWEYHPDDADKSAEDNVYQLFLTLDHTEVVAHADVNDNVTEASPEEYDSVHSLSTTYTYTYSGDDIQAAIDSGKAQLAENGDGTYTLGFNIQVGHIMNVLVTGTISGDTLYTVASDSTDSSSSESTDSSSASSTDSSSSSASSSTSSSASTSSTSTTTTTTTSTASTSSTASDNTNAGTGATAGIALAGLALAGAAAVVSKRK